MYAGGVPHIVGKILIKVTTLLTLHFDNRYLQKNIGVQNARNFNFGNFKTLDLGVSGKMTFGCNPFGQS
jgi:hypothetical protein